MRLTKSKIAVLEIVINKFQCPHCGKPFNAKLGYNSKKPYSFWVESACCSKGKDEIYKTTSQSMNDKEFVKNVELSSLMYKMKIQMK